MIRGVMRSSLFRLVGLSSLGLSLTALGFGCSSGRDKQEPAKQAAKPAAMDAAPAVAPPEVIHLSFEDDPGFLVPLAAADRFGSFNRLLPGELREAATWASIELTLADGTIQKLESPRSRFGEAGYDLRAAEPGMKLVVFDERSQAIKASFGPLAKIHVTPTAAASSRPKPFPIVIDGKQLVVDADQLASQPTVPEPSKQRPAWSLPTIVHQLAPGCALQGPVIVTAEESLTVPSGRANEGYLRFNQRGSWMFSLGQPGNMAGAKLLRGVTRIELSCRAHAKK
ncbi:MAG: hypothetical protein H6Q90_1047 [Deltaproteobacteria bacterium]|nr:hypothetical protein [Deltaproteobacteria bacterium]